MKKGERHHERIKRKRKRKREREREGEGSAAGAIQSYSLYRPTGLEGEAEQSQVKLLVFLLQI